MPPGGKGKGKGGKGGKGPRFNRQVPKFLEQYAHLLGAERPDQHANDDKGWQSTAVEEGYNDEGGKVVHQFLLNRDREKQQEKEAEAAALQAAEEAATAVIPGENNDSEALQDLPGKVIFKAQKREASSSIANDDGDADDGNEMVEKRKKKKKKIKTLDNKKLLSFEEET